MAVEPQKLQICPSLTYNCTSFHINKLIVTYSNRTNVQPATPIQTCTARSGDSISNLFCWNQSRQAIVVAASVSKFRDILPSGHFLYTIVIDGRKTCSVRVDIEDATTVAPTTATANATSVITSRLPMNSSTSSNNTSVSKTMTNSSMTTPFNTTPQPKPSGK